MSVVEVELTDEQLAAKAYEELDEFGRKAVDNVRQWTTAYNQIATQLKATGADPQALLEALRENPPSEDAEAVDMATKIKAAKAKIFEAEQQLDARLKVHVERIRNNANPERENLEAKAKELDEAIKTGRTFLKKLPGVPAGIERLFPKQERLTGNRKVGVTGIRRIRHRQWTVGEGENAQVYSGASEAAKALQEDTAVFQAAFFQAAGGDDSSKWPASVTFTVKGQTVTSVSTAE